MCMPSAPSAPAPPPPPPPPPEPPKVTDPAVRAARNDEKKRAAAMVGGSAMIATSGQGDLTPANIGAKTLLGQ